jgi:CMP-N,N'-diacetyllegionaminic acid synthase
MPTKKHIGLVGARAGSLRVKDKNIMRIHGHPMIAYSIASAKQSGIFHRVVVSTDSEIYRDIALHYGAEAPFLRPAEFATSTSPDVQWVSHALNFLETRYETYALLRPTSPFRSADTIKRAYDEFLSFDDIDSMRAIKKVTEHPGKMWTLQGDLITPLLKQDDLELPWFTRQYQDLPTVYIQDSSLEIAKAALIYEGKPKDGSRIAPFFTNTFEGFSVDHPSDVDLLESWVSSGKYKLPEINEPPFRGI